MAFNVPSLEDQHAFLIASYKRTFPDADVSQGSEAWLWLLTFAAGVTDNHAHVLNVKNDLMPDSARGDMQIRWGDFSGVTKKAATAARADGALRAIGVPGTTIPANTTFVHVEKQIRYKSVTTDIIGPGSAVDLDVIALATGSETRLSKGARLVFEVPIAGVNEEAELQIDMDDGEDEEDEGDYALRIKSRWKDPVLGGGVTDYATWALEEDGIASAYEYPIRRGVGSVDLAALHKGSGSVRILDAIEVADLQAKLDEKRPVTVLAFRVLQVVEEPTDVEVAIIDTGETQYAWDWDDTIAPGVAGLFGNQLTFDDVTRPASMKAGDRIIFSNGATGRERIVETLGPAANQVTLEEDPAGDVATAATVAYSGGPLVAPVRAAIIRLFDSLGTANPDAKRYGAWEGNLRPNAIGRYATSVSGVLDVEVIEPATTVEASDPTYPDDANIGLITPGRILVRRAS